MSFTLLTLTSEDLRNEKLKAMLPECYALRDIVENNPWHTHQNVLDHVIGVFRGLEEVLQLKFVSSQKKEKIITLLEKKVGNKTKKEILIAATLLHDIAKSITVVTNPKTNTTTCPGHEVLGSVLSEDLVERFEFDKESNNYLRNIVLYHGFVHDVLTLASKNGDAQKYLKLFRQAVGEAWIELLLLGYADMLGSDAQTTLPQEFSTRAEIITSYLNG